MHGRQRRGACRGSVCGWETWCSTCCSSNTRTTTWMMPALCGSRFECIFHRMCSL